MTLYVFDGTWNANHDTGEYGLNTNVVKFARAYRGTKRVVQKSKTDDGPSVRDDFYTEGPGTRHGWFGKLIGGAFGFGGRDRIREATEALKQRFAGGDEVIDVIGFSRGAALALHFCNAIAGLRLSHKNGESRSPTVRFLGLWMSSPRSAFRLISDPCSFIASTSATSSRCPRTSPIAVMPLHSMSSARRFA